MRKPTGDRDPGPAADDPGDRIHDVVPEVPALADVEQERRNRNVQGQRGEKISAQNRIRDDERNGCRQQKYPLYPTCRCHNRESPSLPDKGQAPRQPASSSQSGIPPKLATRHPVVAEMANNDEQHKSRKRRPLDRRNGPAEKRARCDRNAQRRQQSAAIPVAKRASSAIL